jgi:hypothetical protein
LRSNIGLNSHFTNQNFRAIPSSIGFGLGFSF